MSSWVRHYASSLNVVGFFPFSIDLILAMALRSTQPLTEMSTRNIPGDKGRLVRKADSLTAICKPNVYIMWEP
jgi:hypothetical protein